MASTDRWLRSTASIRLRTVATSAVTMCMSTPKRCAEHAARLADAGGGIERIADRQRMQHGAAVAHRMAAGRRQHAGDLAVGDHAVGELDVGDEALAAEAAAGQRHHHGFKLHAGHALGDVDGLADHLLGLGQIDHGAGLHAARRGMGEAEHAHAVAAPAQHVLRRLRLEPRDHADDLAGADIEGGDHGGAPRRHRLHLGREAEAQHGHASPPLRFFLVLLGRLERLVARGGGGIRQPHGDAVGQAADRRRRCRARAISCCGRDRPASASACSGSSSGSSTSTPLFRCRFQRRSATSTEASTCRAIAG